MMTLPLKAFRRILKILMDIAVTFTACYRVFLPQVLFLFFLFLDNESDGLFYTSQDLEYIYFVHSLCLLGRILLYSGGRALFPLVIPDMEGNN